MVFWLFAQENFFKNFLRIYNDKFMKNEGLGLGIRFYTNLGSNKAIWDRGKIA